MLEVSISFCTWDLNEIVFATMQVLQSVIVKENGNLQSCHHDHCSK
jgi:hypothetical protein